MGWGVPHVPKLDSAFVVTRLAAADDLAQATRRFISKPLPHNREALERALARFDETVRPTRPVI